MYYNILRTLKCSASCLGLFFILKETKPEVLAEVEPSDFLLYLIEAMS